MAARAPGPRYDNRMRLVRKGVRRKENHGQTTGSALSRACSSRPRLFLLSLSRHSILTGPGKFVKPYYPCCLGRFTPRVRRGAASTGRGPSFSLRWPDLPGFAGGAIFSGCAAYAANAGYCQDRFGRPSGDPAQRRSPRHLVKGGSGTQRTFGWTEARESPRIRETRKKVLSKDFTNLLGRFFWRQHCLWSRRAGSTTYHFHHPFWRPCTALSISNPLLFRPRSSLPRFRVVT